VSEHDTVWADIASNSKLKPLLARPRLNQCAVDREVFLGQQATGISQAHNLTREALHYLCASKRSRFLENTE
jgi:hypothetical protein